jgi:hypothetical protein
LNAQYTLGYITRRAFDGAWRSIRVRAKELRTRHRRGYLDAPSGSRPAP